MMTRMETFCPCGAIARTTGQRLPPAERQGALEVQVPQFVGCPTLVPLPFKRTSPLDDKSLEVGDTRGKFCYNWYGRCALSHAVLTPR